MPKRSARWFEGSPDATFEIRSSMAAMGYRPEEYVGRPIIGIANSWSDFNNCNLPHKELVENVKRGIVQAGGFPMEFHTITTGADFMKPSDLPYRNLMAMDLEEMIRSYPMDGVVLLCECDKTCPGQLMAAASADIPALQFAAGHRASGTFQGRRVTYATDFWHYLDEFTAGNLSRAQWHTLESSISCSTGGCAVMGTASTMKCLSEILGLMLPGTADIPSSHSARRTAAERTGQRIVAMVEEDLRPSQLMTHSAFRNAIHLLAAMGGSTNALLHLTAIAGRRGIVLRLEDYAKIFREVPLIMDLQPVGHYNMDDFFQAGGIRTTIRRLLPLLDTACLTASGRTLQEEYQDRDDAMASSPVIGSLDQPVAAAPTLTVLFGTLAPDGAVIKNGAGSPGLRKHQGHALVFEGYEDMMARIHDESLNVDADTVLVLRHCGPVGAPGMPEWGAVPIPQKLLRQGIRDMVRVSDARMSGTGFGTVVLHVAPESAVGGPLGLVEDGDLIALDVDLGRIDLLVSDPILERRRKSWRERPASHLRGYLKMFADHVLQAPEGCDLDFLRPESEAAIPFVDPVVGRS